jgi:preprotein translocase subunit SecE
MEQLSLFFKETFDEVRYRVTWPTFSELQKSSAMVLAGSIIFAIVVGLMDYAFDFGLTKFYASF